MVNLDLKNIGGLIWDMDGVLVDVSQSYREVIRQTVQLILKKDVAVDEVQKIKNIVGMNNDWDATYALVYNARDADGIDRASENYKEIYDTFQQLYLGDSKKSGLIDQERLLIDEDILKKLKNRYKIMAIATGRPRYEADYVLKKYNLYDVFNLTVAMEDTKRGKPFPDPILKVMETLKLKNTVYTGDSPSDVAASEKAGIPSIYIGREQLGNYNFPTITNLIEFLL